MRGPGLGPVQRIDRLDDLAQGFLRRELAQAGEDRGLAPLARPLQRDRAVPAIGLAKELAHRLADVEGVCGFPAAFALLCLSLPWPRWRLAALERYDGQIWQSETTYRSATGSLPGEDVAPSRRLVQDYEITGLSQFWLPAAYRPVAITHDEARVNPASLTLLTGRETALGLRYQVISEIPTYGPDDFAARAQPLPDDLTDQLELPGGIHDAVRQLAVDITAGTVSSDCPCSRSDSTWL